MRFIEIELSEALRIIGEGNPENNLFFYRKNIPSADLQNYDGYQVPSTSIKERKWFIRIEEDTTC